MNVRLGLASPCHLIEKIASLSNVLIPAYTCMYGELQQYGMKIIKRLLREHLCQQSDKIMILRNVMNVGNELR